MNIKMGKRPVVGGKEKLKTIFLMEKVLLFMPMGLKKKETLKTMN